MIRRWLTLVLLWVISLTAMADHIAGGEISWECKVNGKYVFTLKLYRQCTGIPLGATSGITGGPTGNIPVSRVSFQDISPQCYDPNLQMDCYATVPADRGSSMEEHIYVSGEIQLPTTAIPAGGYTFEWNSCCRTHAPIMDNLHPQDQSYRLRAVMLPYTPSGSTTALPAHPCYDSSPRFAERPATIICTGYPFTYNHNAIDDDLDSLTYEWGQPLLSNGGTVSYASNLNPIHTVPRPSGGGFVVPAPGFSYTVPLPWSHPNMDTRNVPASIDINTGEISFTSYTPGQYVTVIKVSAYKCRQKIAEIYRDIPVVLLKCPPTATTPPITNRPPLVSFSDTNNVLIPLPATDTVLAGEDVWFKIRSSDIQFLPTTPLSPQTVEMYPSGSQFGDKFGDTLNGCQYPPCATLDTTQHFKQNGLYWTQTFGLNTKFHWKTDCNHLPSVNACFIQSNVYNFVFKTLDDFCPAPGLNFSTFTVVVEAPPPIDPPLLKCTRVMPNGDVQLSWDQPVTAAEDTFNSFRRYVVFRSFYPDTGYYPVDTISKIDSLNLTDTVTSTHAMRYYFVQGVSSCNDQGVQNWSDTLSPMYLTATAVASGNEVALEWNPFGKSGLPSSTRGEYDIWQIYQGDTTYVKSTTNTLDTFPVFFCYPSTVSYFVTVEDTTAIYGCTSMSSLDTTIVGDSKPPLAPSIDSLTKDLSNNLVASWQATDADVDRYVIHLYGQAIDTVNASVTSYSFPQPIGDTASAIVSIQAIDSCDNVGVVGLPHQSLWTEITSVSRCDTNEHITLYWTLYGGVDSRFWGNNRYWWIRVMVFRL